LRRVNDQKGFASLEILVAASLVAMALFSIAAMFLTAQTTVKRSGDRTVTVALARRVIEDMRAMPFTSLVALDGFDTADASSLPSDEPERDIARRWRYAVAGDGAGWNYSATEMLNWPTFALPGPPMRGTLVINSPSSGMREIRVTIAVPRDPKELELVTLITRTEP